MPSYLEDPILRAMSSLILGTTFLMLQVFVQLRRVVALCGTECTTQDSTCVLEKNKRLAIANYARKLRDHCCIAFAGDPSHYYSLSLDCQLPDVSAIIKIKNDDVPYSIRELYLECDYSLTANNESCVSEVNIHRQI